MGSKSHCSQPSVSIYDEVTHLITVTKMRSFGNQRGGLAKCPKYQIVLRLGRLKKGISVCAVLRPPKLLETRESMEAFRADIYLQKVLL